MSDYAPSKGVMPLEAGVEMARAMIVQGERIEALHVLLREVAAFIESDPPALRRGYKEWQAERDTLLARVQEAGNA